MKKQKKGSVSGKRRQRKSFLKPVRKTGMETKNPATAQMRVTAESLKNFLMLNTKRPKVKNKDTNMLKEALWGYRERERKQMSAVTLSLLTDLDLNLMMSRSRLL